MTFIKFLFALYAISKENEHAVKLVLNYKIPHIVIDLWKSYCIKGIHKLRGYLKWTGQMTILLHNHYSVKEVNQEVMKNMQLQNLHF